MAASTIVRAKKPRKQTRKRCPTCGSEPNCTHSPATQMRTQLATSRGHGIEFESAWEAAVARVRWPHDTDHRRDWKQVIDDLHDVWKRAYYRRGEGNRALVAIYSLMQQAASAAEGDLAA